MVLIGEKRSSPLSSSLRAAAKSIALQIFALSVEDAMAEDALGMVVVSKL